MSPGELFLTTSKYSHIVRRKRDQNHCVISINQELLGEDGISEFKRALGTGIAHFLYFLSHPCVNTSSTWINNFFSLKNTKVVFSSALKFKTFIFYIWFCLWIIKHLIWLLFSHSILFFLELGSEVLRLTWLVWPFPFKRCKFRNTHASPCFRKICHGISA